MALGISIDFKNTMCFWLQIFSSWTVIENSCFKRHEAMLTQTHDFTGRKMEILSRLTSHLYHPPLSCPKWWNLRNLKLTTLIEAWGLEQLEITSPSLLTNLLGLWKVFIYDHCEFSFLFFIVIKIRRHLLLVNYYNGVRTCKVSFFSP